MNEEWKKLELSKVFTISKNKFNPKKSDEHRRCIELEHLSQETGKFIGYIDSSKQQSIKNVFKKDQVLFGKLRPYLKKYWKASFDGVCSTEIWVLDGKNVTNNYLFQLIQTNKFNQVANVSSGSKMPRADWNYMSEIPFDVPPLKEQQKIAEILTTWDDAISKQEELIKAKEELKKGLMQKLLSGEVRFDGFSGIRLQSYKNETKVPSPNEWEEVRLGDIGKTYNGLTGKTAEDFHKGNSNFITYKNIFDNDKLNNSILAPVQISSNEKQNKAKLGDIFFTVSSETPEEVGMSSVLLDEANDIYLNSFCFGYRLNSFDLLLPGFARFYFRSFYIRDKIMRLAQGSTRFNLSKIQVMKIKIKLPSLKEQQKIAQVLSTADKEIELLKNELESLKKQKKGLMQRLLSGEVRVKI